MTPSYYERHPWAVNLYMRKAHIMTEYFRHESAARFYLRTAALHPGQTAYLMRYQGNFEWAERMRRPYQNEPAAANRVPLQTPMEGNHPVGID